MSNEAQLYSLGFVTVKGMLLTEEGYVDVQRATNSQEVKTTAKGYAGESPGAATVQIQVTSAVPAADFEMNPGPYMAALKQAEVSVFAAGKQLNAKGFIISDSFKHSVDGVSSLEFTFRGTFVDWK
jgi:hypothetical protein